jgi:hypothetical protein
MTRIPAHPLRVRTGRDVHAARAILAGGHNTACLTWLSPDHARHEWMPDTSPVTCPACQRRLTKDNR